MNSSNHKFILVGASTGGPTLLEKIVSALPASMEASVILVQHMQKFPLVSFAKRLDRLCIHDVVLVQDSHVFIEKQKVYVLYDSAKIIQEDNRFRFEMIEEDTFYHPCIDTLFSSAIVLEGASIYAYLLTGIGQDGVKGLQNLQGIATRIAQDKNSSAVYGMPRAAVEAGVVESVKSIDEIIAEIAKVV